MDFSVNTRSSSFLYVIETSGLPDNGSYDKIGRIPPSNLKKFDILDFCIKAYKKVINDLEEKIEKGKNRGSTIYDYIDELENIETGLGQDFIGELIDSCDFIYTDDSGNYYDSSVGSDSMTDDPLELIDGAMDYADLVGEYGFPEEYAKGVNNG